MYKARYVQPASTLAVGLCKRRLDHSLRQSACNQVLNDPDHIRICLCGYVNLSLSTAYSFSPCIFLKELERTLVIQLDTDTFVDVPLSPPNRHLTPCSPLWRSTVLQRLCLRVYLSHQAYQTSPATTFLRTWRIILPNNKVDLLRRWEGTGDFPRLNHEQCKFLTVSGFGVSNWNSLGRYS